MFKEPDNQGMLSVNTKMDMQVVEDAPTASMNGGDACEQRDAYTYNERNVEDVHPSFT